MRRASVLMIVVPAISVWAAGCGDLSSGREKALQSQLAETQQKLRETERALQSAKAEADDYRRKTDDWRKEVDRVMTDLGNRDVEIIMLRHRLKMTEDLFAKITDELADIRRILEKLTAKKAPEAP